MEDFVNYKLPSLFIGTAICDWKCCTEQNLSIEVCQNSTLAQSPVKEININNLVEAYINNPITKAIVIGGLEPFLQFYEIVNFIHILRMKEDNSPIVIYTGYNEDEIMHRIIPLKYSYNNIIIKFGRYIPNHEPHYDEELGVFLASDNQYARKIS